MLLKTNTHTIYGDYKFIALKKLENKDWNISFVCYIAKPEFWAVSHKLQSLLPLDLYVIYVCHTSTLK